MEARQTFQRLFIFDLWCTRKITDLLTEETDFSSRTACIAFLSHIINAQRIWLDRVLDLNISQTDPWKEFELAEIRREAKDVHKMWVDLIGDHDMNMEAKIVYQNSKGTNYSNRFREICTHLIMHGQHHRAQINLLLNQADIQPPPIDYIHYMRSVT